MKKIEENVWLYILAYGVTVSIMGIILYPLFDMVWCKFLTRSDFKYNVYDHIISPIIFGVTFAVICGIYKFKKKK